VFCNAAYKFRHKTGKRKPGGLCDDKCKYKYKFLNVNVKNGVTPKHVYFKAV